MIAALCIGIVLGAVAAVLLIMWISRWHLKTQAMERARTAKVIDSLSPLKGILPIDKHWFQEHGHA